MLFDAIAAAFYAATMRYFLHFMMPLLMTLMMLMRCHALFFRALFILFFITMMILSPDYATPRYDTPHTLIDAALMF